ncbi:hypothetical protein [Pseudomonas sp. CGJS7]|uniref:hypothetical protein n=1 Tax=Pseudomonas sp. CGJS7 TaxID=3109348 RepID=UPI00300AF65A
MRRVNRDAVAAPVSLTADDGAGKSEGKRAHAHYQAGNKGSYAFSAYKGDDVAEAMFALFHGKCAYCESFHSASSPTDVEHYRPKAGVEGEAGHRGYWWLAADWNNLLPSCILCNRRNGLRVAGEGMGLAQLALQPKTTVGKGNHFPIRGQRASGPSGDCEAEDPLLIDPTRRDPSVHLCWPEAELSMLSMLSATFRDGDRDPYGQKTIDVLGLNRQYLVEARTGHLAMVRARLADIEWLLRLASQLPLAPALETLARVESNLDQLQAMASGDRPYSAMVAAYLQQRLQSLLADNRDLLAKVRAQAAAGAVPV